MHARDLVGGGEGGSPTCAPCRVGARSWSWRRAMALPAVVSSFMKTLHSVVLRCAVQYLFGYELAE